MANEQHLRILKQGVEAWNQWRKENPKLRPDLSGANLRRANLTGADLVGADLSGANLFSANLRGANLSGADLILAILVAANLCLANLSRADLAGANLRLANLTRADLVGAHLIRANLFSANLSGAKLGNARLGWTLLADVDLREPEGLETVRHSAPSTVGIDTIYRSKGNIPEAFLRGAGVPEDFIIYVRSLAAKAIQYYSCFIAHSSKDRLFSEKLYADLVENGVRTWYFPEDARWGKRVWGEIDLSIKEIDKLLVVCSENSLQSGPVLREIERALIREDREGKNILFPITIDDYIFDSWEHERKADVLSKVVGDFRGWDQSAEEYNAAFKKLLAALEAAD